MCLGIPLDSPDRISAMVDPVLLLETEWEHVVNTCNRCKLDLHKEANRRA
jgi:hypothetical protein